MTTNHEINVFVRFCETDAVGHVNNASYFFYLEEARTKFFYELGVFSERQPPLINFILASTKCDYLEQAYAGQILNVSTVVSKIGKKSFTVTHEITTANTDTVIARATATLVCFNYLEQRTEVIPEEFKRKLKQWALV